MLNAINADAGTGGRGAFEKVHLILIEFASREQTVYIYPRESLLIDFAPQFVQCIYTTNELHRSDVIQ